MIAVEGNEKEKRMSLCDKGMMIVPIEIRKQFESEFRCLFFLYMR